ncbi:MAG: hypothetical protein HKO59_02775 [Phycisphaerales bacterium]|nr:hypothetical protein [Phycisphaerales bacterium]NNM24905.1 hypothetical protein [Phycisphaerales bacterium]
MPGSRPNRRPPSPGGSVGSSGSPPTAPDDAHDTTYHTGFDETERRDHHDDDWPDWHWWHGGGGHHGHHRHHGHHLDYYYGSRWHGWSFSFGYYADHAPWWFSIGFGHHGHRFHFGHGFHRPWHHYRLHYRTCSISYARPWRSYHRSYGGYGYHGPRFRHVYRAGHGFGCDCGYCTTYVRPYWYSSYRTSTPVYAPAQSTYVPLVPTIDQGWDQLADDQLEAALATFADLVYAVPHDAAARIGYAIAAGRLGYDIDAAMAMRRAMVDDASALFDVPTDALVLDQVQRLLDVYRERLRSDRSDIDALFMSAALQMILDDPALAFHAIDAAIDAGDDDPSAQRLRVFIDDELYRRFGQ